MRNMFMVLLSLAVVLTAAGVLFWFFKRLKRIEDDLWGTKRQEAAETAKAATADEASAEPADDTTES